MKVLVTGANGFVGSALCTYLDGLGHEVVPTVRRSSGISGEYVVGDVSLWKAALKGCHSVVHLAARAHVMHDMEKNPEQAFRSNNVDATLDLAIRAVDAGVRRFVFISTVKVNGEETAAGCGFKPNDPPAPKDPYAISKWEAEQGLFEIAQRTGLELVIIRAPLVYGPGVKGNFAAMVRWVRKGVPLPLGVVHNQRSLLALDNLLDFIALCVDVDRSPHAANQVFLISDCEDVSVTELLRKVACAYGVKPRLLPVPALLIQAVAKVLGKSAVADRLLGSLVVDGSKAREVLGWRPLVSMDEQLRTMALHDSCI